MKLACLILLPFLLHAESALRAGLARVNITPPNGQPMSGWSERTRGATATHDPLYATVLLLDSGSNSLAIVACDLESLVSTRIAAEARQKFGVAHTILSMSGTHSGPATGDSKSHWRAGLEDKIVAAIGEAKQSLFPAELTTAAGRAYLSFNRRKVTEQQARMWWRNPDGLPSHPVDPAVNILCVRDKEKVRAVLVNYAARATVLGPANLEFSADYPGALRRYVETQAAGALCLFVQGASGDISPNREREPGKAPAFAAADSMGSELAAEVMRLIKISKPLSADGEALRVADGTSEISFRFAPAEHMTVGYAAGIIGGGLCFLALPGEPFIELQMTFRARSECPMAMLFGSSYSGNGVWAGAMPTIRAAAEGGEGAAYDTLVAVGAGELLVDRGAIELFKLRGLAADLPDPRF